MLVNFIGGPCSGKTTCAATVFAALKEAGVSAEFLPEQARMYIAARRAVASGPITLSELDQMLIMRKQLDTEALMQQACGDSVVIVTDGSPLNSLLYMSQKTRQEASVLGAVQQQRQHKAMTFYLHTVTPGFGVDPNRIHDIQTSHAIDLSLPKVMAENAPWLTYIPLFGGVKNRSDSVLALIFAQLLHPTS